jgi:hypothetical protein
VFAASEFSTHRTDTIIPHANSVTALILHILSMNHPNGNLENILTFMWCLWKSRNDNLFNGKNGHPTQIYLMANAIKQNLEML